MCSPDRSNLSLNFHRPCSEWSNRLLRQSQGEIAVHAQSLAEIARALNIDARAMWERRQSKEFQPAPVRQQQQHGAPLLALCCKLQKLQMMG